MLSKNNITTFLSKATGGYKRCFNEQKPYCILNFINIALHFNYQNLTLCQTLICWIWLKAISTTN
jgi:hypothetical protein